jgi:Tfp pilus assembly protein PilE
LLKNEKGFTLVKLIVIVILFILVAIAVLLYGYVITQLNNIANQAFIRIIENAALKYISDQGTNSHSVTLATEVVDESSALAPYLNLPIVVPGTKAGTYSVTIEKNRVITVIHSP